jgi:CRP-like cAMP-binding protein
MATPTLAYALATPGTNRLLESLPDPDRGAILPRLEHLSFQVPQQLYEQDGLIEHAYFLLDGITSTTTLLEDGGTVEVGLAGAEGFLGHPLLLGRRQAAQRSFAQVSGAALRLEADVFLALCREHPALHTRLLHYTDAMFSQTCQFAACNRLHEAEERLARWLLMVQDRLASDELPLTHEFLGMMLGTRRSTVTVSAGVLQRAGMIDYARGHIRIRDRALLEGAACECYRRGRQFVEAVFA